MLILLLVLAAPLVSCSLDDDGVNFNFVALQIVSAELPESFVQNQTYEISVTYVRPNGCTFFEGFDISESDTTVRNVVAVGSELQDTACTQEAEEVEATFNFIVLHSEDYIFRFWTGEDADGEPEFIEIEVPVL
ncbi:hypothetical protein GTQ38_02825 [Flavobacteriaceae bacterium R33]|uniref:Uncharacterized protein n=2 Tax=Poritiphilus flavus TaxID=2697053 RepID=A0A6L9E8X7_9FLAO|nr:hypothetical protein [Poritiphilus flavus]